MNRRAALEGIAREPRGSGFIGSFVNGITAMRCLAFKAAVSELCQNPTGLECLGLLFEREQIPQVVDIRHFPME